MLNLKKKVKKKEIVVVVIPPKKYREGVVEIAKFMKGFKKPCFVTLNKPYFAINEDFQKHKIDTDKFFFIDGVSEKSEQKKKIKNCVFLRSPHNLSDLSINISSVLKKFKADIIVFDSLSTLLIYEKTDTLLKFVHNIVGKIRVQGCTTIFAALEGDAETKLFRDLVMLVDKLVE